MGAKEDAIVLKDKGNVAFKNHDWPAAIESYSKAIEIYDQEASFFTNRAQVPTNSPARDTWKKE